MIATKATPIQRLAELYAAVDDAERDLERADQHGDAAATIRAQQRLDAAVSALARAVGVPRQLFSHTRSVR